MPSQISIVRGTTTNSYSLVPTPVCPAPRSITYTASDAVATVKSEFSNATQTQYWPGADLRSWTVNLPPMQRSDAAQWFAFLMSLRGQAYVFQMGDPDGAQPQGNPSGAPAVDGSVSTNNTPGSNVLYTTGWTPSTYRLLLPGDYLQIGYRLYNVVESPVDSDANGAAQINIWPSLREQPAGGTAITLASTQGLFRLADNTRQWSYDVAQAYGISFRIVEAI